MKRLMIVAIKVWWPLEAAQDFMRLPLQFSTLPSHRRDASWCDD
jgi:hypothetical protein